MKNRLNVFSANGGSVTVNGRRYSGKSITMQDGRLTVDGVVQDESYEGDISVIVEGNVNSIETEGGDITIKGDCGSARTMSGDVNCQTVVGVAKTMSGDIICSGDISGNASTMSGDIRR